MVISRQDMELGRLWQVADGVSAATVLEWSHRLVHEGRMFRYHAKFTLANQGDVKRFLLVANTNYDAHFLVQFTSDQKLDYALYHNPTLTSNGTDITAQAFSRKLGHTATPHSTIYTDPVPTADGTMIDGYYLDKGILLRQESEFELEPGEKIMAVFTAEKDAQIVHVSVDWYEEED